MRTFFTLCNKLINTFTFIALTLLIIAGCSSPQKMIIKQKYDGSIDVLVKKILKKPSNEKAIDKLKSAYQMANERDLSDLKLLLTKGDPDIWERVYNLYAKLKYRQAKVSRLPPSVLQSIGFERYDYDVQLVEARNKAADYAFSKGNELLQRGDKLSAREAFYQFKKVQKYIPSYPSLQTKLEAAKEVGTSFTYITVDNNSRIVLPDTYAPELTKLMVADIGNEWLIFTEVYDRNISYDYYVNLDIKEILISPEAMNSKEYTEQKSIEDGWEYVLDDNGNVKKDADGNDIKQKIIKEVQCHITHFMLRKSAKVKGTINAYNHHTKQLLLSEPLFSESFFSHDYAVVRGDKRALTSKSKKLAKKPAIPFPNNIDLILQTNDNLKKVAKSFIRRNNKIFL